MEKQKTICTYWIQIYQFLVLPRYKYYENTTTSLSPEPARNTIGSLYGKYPMENTKIAENKPVMLLHRIFAKTIGDRIL